MPKSKRARVIHLTKVDKKGKEHTQKLFASVQTAVEEHTHVFVFAVDNMRNAALKNVRAEFLDSKIIFGKSKIMAKALGTTPETAILPNTNLLAPYIRGPVGLLFTSRAPSAILPYFADFSTVDFARAGNAATRDFVIPPGTVYSRAGEVAAEDDVPLAHSIEPELRKLSVPTRLVKGKIELEMQEGTEGYVVCREGDVLDSRQTRLLKMFGVATADFKIRVVAYWSAASQDVTVVDADAAGEDGHEDDEA